MQDKMLSDLLMKLEEKYQDDPDVAKLSDLLAEDVDNEDMGDDMDMGDEDFEIAPAIPMAEEDSESPADFDTLMAEDMGEEDEMEPADEPVPVTGTNAKKKKKMPLA